ncbi:hypothetical protein [Paenibacillus sp. J2TS4]|uniref:putative ABC transporter permease subunit n=1 Tax=Paenibacillus sp. J2TS4 TaxID=2807194 RepID=UPI001B0E57FF|nr:hypothetical protein [Paenibacillus sp. J2TS4]GIP33842.1 hypothetical protein J2TS4_30520 [Paenibacillus sp. J2TS4]
MNKTLSLTKILLKNGSGTWGSKNSSKKRRIPIGVLVPILIAIGLIPVFSIFYFFISSVYDGLAPIGQEGLILALGLTTVSLVVFFFGIFYVINVFFFAQDLEHLLPLPVKPSQILTAKFSVALVYEYLTELFILMPILITYGIKSGAGILYYVYSAVIFLTLPVLPLLLASFISMLIMRFTNVSKHRDRYRMIGGAAAIFLGIGFNFFFQRFAKNKLDPEQLQQIVAEGNNSIIQTITTLFPNAKLGAFALINEASLIGFGYLLFFLAISAIAYWLFMLLGNWIYFKSVMGMSESSSRRQKVSDEKFDKMTQQSSVLKAYTVKELKVLFRTPAYFTNCVIISFLWPLLLVIPLVAQSGSLEGIKQLSPYLFNENTAGLVLVCAFGFFLFTAGINPTAATAISREGQGVFINKYLPVPFSKIVMAKVLSGFVLNFVSVLLAVMIAYFLLALPLYYAILLLALGVPAVLFGAFIGIIIDIHFPKLNWDNEQKAVKQNMNSLFSTLLCFLTAALIVVAVFFFNPSMPVVFFGLLLGFGLINFLLYRLVKAKSTNWFNKIEV